MKGDERRSVAELRLQLAKQDEAWARAKSDLRALGDVTVGVPEEALEAIANACAPRVALPSMHAGAVRA